MSLVIRRVINVIVLLVFGLIGKLAFGDSPYAMQGVEKYRLPENLLAVDGPLEDLEPKLSEVDKEVYQLVAPLLNADRTEALAILEPQVTPESNAAFDFLLGNLYYAEGEYAKAVSWLEKSVEKMPSFRRAYRIMALCLVQVDRLSETIPCWLKVITLGGGDAQSYGLLGYAYLAGEHYYSALKAYEMARMYNAESMDFKRGQAQCLLMTGQGSEAISLYDELIVSDPDVAEFWLLQTNAYLSLNDKEKAISNLELLRSIGKLDWNSVVLLGDLYLARESFALAAEAYLQGLDFVADQSVESMLTPLQRLLGFYRYDEADAYLSKLEDVAGTQLDDRARSEVTISRAQIQMDRGNLDAAVAALQSVVEDDPLEARGLLLLGDVYKRKKDWANAEYFFERARSIETVVDDALLALGRMEVERGRFRAGIAYLREAQRLNPRENVQRYLERVEAISVREDR